MFGVRWLASADRARTGPPPGRLPLSAWRLPRASHDEAAKGERAIPWARAWAPNNPRASYDPRECAGWCGRSDCAQSRGTASGVVQTLRIAMTAADIPTASGIPNNGGEGYRFLGLPAFDGLVGWDFTHPNQIAGLTPRLATGIAGHRAGIG